MASFAPTEMYGSQQQQQQPQTFSSSNEMYASSQHQQQLPSHLRMGGYPLDLSYNHMQYQGPSSPPPGSCMQYQGPSSPPPGGCMQYQGPTSPPPGSNGAGGSCESSCQPVASIINHRVFVGSLQIDVTEEILKNVFEKTEPTLSIRDTKIVRESNGQSKGYGFVTYATEEDAQKVISKPPGSFMYKNRAWNIAPAVRRYTSHGMASNFVCYPYSPSLFTLPNGGLVSYLPQQVYSSPFITSPMNESQFVFPPPAQQ